MWSSLLITVFLGFCIATFFDCRFDEVEELRCEHDYQDIHQQSCSLMWKDGPFDFIVKKKRVNDNHWQFVSNLLPSPQYSFWGLRDSTDYEFAVVRVSILGESRPTTIVWRHISKFTKF